MDTSTKKQLSEIRQLLRDEKKELKRVRGSRNAVKLKCSDLTKTLKLQKLRLKETQDSREKWKLGYKKELQKTKTLTLFNKNLEELLGLKKEELINLRAQIATEKKISQNEF